MRITESQLRRIIRQERTRLTEVRGGAGTGSKLLEFARAYAGLGAQVTAQVDDVVGAFLAANGDPSDDTFVDTAMGVNPAAIRAAVDALGPLLESSMGELGDEADAVMGALYEAEALAGG